MQIPVDKNRKVKARTVHVFESDGSAPGGIDALPGDCQYREQHGRLMLACPGCGEWGGINCGHPKPEQQPSWDIISGDPNQANTLTLSPSINCVGCCGWHGYLKDGEFIPC